MNSFIPVSALENAGGGSLGGIIMILPVLLIFVVLIWFQSRSQKKRDQEVTNMRNNLQVGDEVTTIGGIIGKIVSIKEETCVIVTSRDNTKIRILKSAISHVDVKAEDSID